MAAASKYIGAIDQGTTSTRFILFDASGTPVASASHAHKQHFPASGFVEHDPEEIWARTQRCIVDALAAAGATPADVAAVGITNQRETLVVWDRDTGKPYHNAIVWQDQRGAPLCAKLASEDNLGTERFRAQTGLPLVPYFTASKLAWCLENVPGLRADAEAGRALAGTIDSFLIWRLTGGREHATDVTNASRTLLFNIHTLTWDDALLRAFGVPRAMLPRVVSSSTRVAQCAASSALAGVPIAGVLGDQQAALFGQVCFSPGDAKNTYGTGCFLLMNAGTVVPKPPVEAGLLVTVAYQIGSAPPVYALEGSVAVAGAAVSWLRDNLGLISSPAELETLAASVPHTSGAVFVPAFNGLFAPHWRTDARGVLVGLSGAVGRAQIARATLEAVAHQTRELLGAMEAGAGAAVKGADLKVDGGMTVNNTLMQFQADVTGRRCVRPVVAETTALGAAYAAGLAVGFWKDQNALQSQWKESAAWAPAMPAADVAKSVLNWDRALARALHWQVTEPKADATLALLRGGGRASTAAAAAAVNSAGAVRVVGKGRPALFAAACAGAVAGGVLVHAWREGGSSFI